MARWEEVLFSVFLYFVVMLTCVLCFLNDLSRHPCDDQGWRYHHHTHRYGNIYYRHISLASNNVCLKLIQLSIKVMIIIDCYLCYFITSISISFFIFVSYKRILLYSFCRGKSYINVLRKLN